MQSLNLLTPFVRQGLKEECDHSNLLSMRKFGLFQLFCILFLGCLAGIHCLGEGTTVQELLLDTKDEKRDRVVPLKIYLPELKDPFPVVLFSHGLGGSRENNKYLGLHWAEDGFVGVFLQHAGSDAEVWKSAKPGQRMSALKAAASAQSSKDRIADVSYVLDQLGIWNKEKGHILEGKLNLEKVGMSGHSFGAVTTMAVAGRKFPFSQSYPEERIDAFFAMSPQSGKGLPASKAFGHLEKPILCMSGTKDGSPIDPGLNPESRKDVYAAMPHGDKYQLILDGGEHFAFGDQDGRSSRNRNPKHHPAIQQISVQFWNAY